MFTVRRSRQEMYADDPKFLWKYILRSLAIVLALTSIGLIGWSLAHPTVLPNDLYDNYNYSYYGWSYNSEYWYLPWEFITLGLSIFWNVANILVLLFRQRPIHPGANVACDLLLWLGFVVTGTIATGGAETYLWWYPNDYDNLVQDGVSTNDTTINRKGIIIAVGAALSFVVMLMHFALFISACRYTSARRLNDKATVIAERMHNEKLSRDAAGQERNLNAGFAPVSERVEQQTPLNYGMPPAPTGMTVGDKVNKWAVVAEGQQGRGVRYSYEQPEVVCGPSGEHSVAAYANNAHEA